MEKIRCIAWDFDGVLNRGVENGRFVWQDLLPKTFGVDRDVFTRVVFGDGFWPVMRGEKDVLDHLAEWKDHVGFDGDVEAVMAFWFREDDKPCPDMLGLMDRVAAAGFRQVIATNNEHRRSSYIENEMGFAGRIEAMFSSGRMKVAKPDPGYFRFIEDAMQLEPHELMLVDDYAENIEAAEACGWHIHHFPENGHKELVARLEPIL